MKEINEGSDVVILPTGFECLLCLYSMVADHFDSLTDREKSFVGTAVKKRRNEYATGRWLSRNALARFGVNQFELLPGKRRQPIWPEDLVGSISHTEHRAVVAVAERGDYRGIGIDLEYNKRVDQASLPMLLSDAEIRRYRSIDRTLIFSAKEACYKLLNPLTHVYVDFLDIEIDLFPADDAFAVRYVGSCRDNAVIETARGKYAKLDNYWLTLIVLGN